MTQVPVPKMPTGIRIVSMLLDHFFLSLLAFIFSLPLFAKLMMTVAKDPNNPDLS